jgi:hypothetical protein
VQYRRHYRRTVRHYRPRVHRRVVVRRPYRSWGYRHARTRVVVRRPYRSWGYRRAYWGWGSPYRYSSVGWGPYYSWGYPYYRRPFRHWGPGFGVRIGPVGFGFW